jgi:trigger factor
MVDDDSGQAQRDYIVELGSGRLLEELEQGVIGLGAGESRELRYERGDGGERRVTVAVKEIKQKVLPPLDDEVARTVSEFERLDDLRADIETTLREQLEEELDKQFRADVVDKLVAATDVQAAGPLVEARTRELLRGLARTLERQGVDPDLYFAMTGQTPEELEGRVRAEASQSVARELVLEAVADKLQIEVSDEELKALIREQAAAAGDDAEGTIDELFARGAHESLREDLRLRAALDRVAAEVKRIPAELAAAREKLWTPEKEKQPSETKLWTPGSKESA